MKATAILFAVVIAGSCVLRAQEPLVMSKSLPTHGTLAMEMNLGEVRILRSDETKTIRLTIEPRGEDYGDATMRSWVRALRCVGRPRRHCRAAAEGPAP
jgi:hypothetical protein